MMIQKQRLLAVSLALLACVQLSNAAQPASGFNAGAITAAMRACVSPTSWQNGYGLVREGVVNSSWIMKNPMLQKFAQDHFGKIVGGTLGACIFGFIVRQANVWWTNKTFRETVAKNPAELREFMTRVYRDAMQEITAGIGRALAKKQDRVVVEIPTAGFKGTALKVVVERLRSDNGKINGGRITSLNRVSGKEWSYIVNGEDPFSRLRQPNNDENNTNTLDPGQIEGAMREHALATYVDGGSGWLTQALPVWNGSSPNLLPHKDIDVYTNDETDARSQVAITDSLGNFVWPEQNQQLQAIDFAGMLYWASRKDFLINELHNTLISRRVDVGSNQIGRDYKTFQVAGVRPISQLLCKTDPYFGYNFVVGGQERRFEIRGYQNKRAFTDDWRSVWHWMQETRLMAQHTPSKQQPVQIIRINKDDVDKFYKRGAYSEKRKHGDPLPVSVTGAASSSTGAASSQPVVKDDSDADGNQFMCALGRLQDHVSPKSPWEAAKPLYYAALKSIK